MASNLYLPPSLLLLVHLHLLEYREANRPEYDDHLFDPRTRGLRERAKTMEDVFYFMVQRLEGKGKENQVKMILTTYPCSQPSDSVAFRTSLSKYLESLRHSAIFAPTSNSHKSASGEKGKPSLRIEGAWWWKDVAVRKSLLEECSGEKFERLILSTSTHALLKGLRTQTIPEANAFDQLQTLPYTYANLLASCQLARSRWSVAATRLLQRQILLKEIRDNLLHSTPRSSKYATIGLDRLSELAEAKLKHLQRLWQGEAGSRALLFLLERVGVVHGVFSSDPRGNPADEATVEKSIAAVHVPLPIAAAHHISHLKKLSKPIFELSNRQKRATTHGGPKGVSGEFLAFTEAFEKERRTHAALNNAIDLLRKRRDQCIPEIPPLHLHTPTEPKLQLWDKQRKHRPVVDFEVEFPGETMSSSLLQKPEGEDDFDFRIEHIRATVLPKYPVPKSFEIEQIDPVVRSILNLQQHQPSTRIPRAARGPPKPSTTRSHQQVGVPGQPRGSANASPRKSIRKSIAVARRATLANAQDKDLAAIHKIVQGIEDTSIEEDFLVMSTPKHKTPNRIFTSGTRGASTVRRQPKKSLAVVFQEPTIALPSLLSSTSSSEGGVFRDGGGNVSWGQSSYRDILVGDKEGDDDDEEVYEDGASTSLRDILIGAGSTQFDLLGSDEMLDQSVGDW